MPPGVAPLLRGTVSLGPARIAGRLFDLGAYPGAVPGGDGEVHGELLQLPDAAALAGLDRYEGVDPVQPGRGLYRRIRTRARAEDGLAHPCFAYVLASVPAGAREIPGGAWRG